MNHRDQVLRLLKKQVSNASEVDDIRTTAEKVVAQWANPVTGGREETNGLIYGLVQSGKTGVLTVTGAMGADEGYRTIVILTSDNDPLYEQTLGRAQEAFPGMDILGKADIRDSGAFLQRIKGNVCVIVITKNSGLLSALIENFKTGRVRGLSCLIIDDEADQASLNTQASRSNGTVSAINSRITELRAFFEKNTYLQVTATPQALFLQDAAHEFRPKFTVLSHPGADYVGGDDFFGDKSTLVREFDLLDITALAPGSQPVPALTLPASLTSALDTFMIGATYKRLRDVDQNCAFLCHVSTRTSDHRHIVDLLRRYKTALAVGLKEGDERITARLKLAYDDLAATDKGLAHESFDELVKAIGFFSPGITVKLVNGETDEDVAVRSPYNLFVGGNKLGRGVTIKNLLVSYYGRNPRAPQADTVLQHARMYGYRRKDIGLLRLYLPPQLHTVFRAINRMEKSLRDLIEKRPSEAFRGIYIEGGLNATRRSVLAPGSMGIYTGGASYNPSQVLRDAGVATQTAKIDELLKDVQDKSYKEMPIEVIRSLIRLTAPDPRLAEKVWDSDAVAESVGQYAKLWEQKTGYVYVDRGRELLAARRETQGILDGGEIRTVPADRVTLFMLRNKASGALAVAWWPQMRFPTGRYAFAFAI